MIGYIPKKTKDGRPLNAINRVPDGYTLCISGESDDIVAGTSGGGEPLQFSSSNKVRTFRQLKHYYAIGARAIWKSCDIDNYFGASLVAPATTGATQQAGNFIKYAVTGGNIFIPVAEGTGDWDMDLSAKLPNTDILMGTPVPSVGNNGWFDYDGESNTLTANTSQTGGYNLCDFEVPLHTFGRKIWGSPANGAVTEMDVTGLVGKLLYNTWAIKLTFDLYSGLLGSEQAAVTFIMATKG